MQKRTIMHISLLFSLPRPLLRRVGNFKDSGKFVCDTLQSGVKTTIASRSVCISHLFNSDEVDKASTSGSSSGGGGGVDGGSAVASMSFSSLFFSDERFGV